LRREKHRFDRLNARVVLVGLGTPPEAAAFARKYDVPFPIIADPEKKLYRAFALKRMSPLGFLSPTLALKGVAAAARGHGIGIPSGDVLQLPGVFVIDTAGRIVFSHYGADPADHPDPEEILAVLRKYAGTTKE